ncbi:HpcH/HpaI aldolase family protein [Aporhodopirellula aestuarii]|uniref:Aldolase/citrate lyase family protein n=1 Tax=Aporhodopirellula aestuarii TaxID=2950107 RepID=A0ABT0U957_9BACT|nr:aldolase/citrate lyase family protein [Aporhodopirellula aestuarii]MCM2372938.1 aldolase/citrate lyase family protein [Aporhodopirellula aestuarii]
MNSESLIQRLRHGDPVIGTLLVSTSPRWPDALRHSGLDFVFIDTEHIAIDRTELSWMCQTYSAMGLAPLVRIPSPDPYAATMVLDGGAAGVVAPYVESANQVKSLRGAVKLRPIRGAKLEQMLNGEPVEPGLAGYVQAGAKTRCLVINIESVAGIDALDEILAVPELDALLIGPHDLSCSLGVPEQYDHPQFLSACDTIFTKARAAGVGAGIHFWGDVDQQVGFLKRGANMLIHSGDISLFQKYLCHEVAAIKKATGMLVQDSSQETIQV